MTRNHARATAARRNNARTSNSGFGSLRRTFQTMMLMPPILRAGEPANESLTAKLRANALKSGPGTPRFFRVGLNSPNRFYVNPPLWGGKCFSMTWIRTIPLSQANEKLRNAMESQRALYPKEYATPVHPTDGGDSLIVESHSLIPDALYHAFSTFGALMSPDLPLSRRQHEMITTVVSVTNRCVY